MSSVDELKTSLAVMKDDNRSLTAREDAARVFLETRVQDFAKFLGDLDKANRWISVTLNCFRRNPDLMKCSPTSIVNSLQQAASLGLDLTGPLGHAYLIPFKTECTLVCGYKGYLRLAMNSPMVSHVTCDAVHEGDTFHYTKGDAESIQHIPSADPKRFSQPILWVYSIYHLANGGKVRTVWSKEQIDDHKERYSKGWGKSDSGWQTAWLAMAMKTVLRNPINRGLVPVSVECAEIANREEIIEAEFTRKEAPQPRQLTPAAAAMLEAFNAAGDSFVEPGLADEKPPETVPFVPAETDVVLPDPPADLERQIEGVRADIALAASMGDLTPVRLAMEAIKPHLTADEFNTILGAYTKKRKELA